MTAFGVDNQTTVEEVTGHLDAGIHNTTGVVSNVKNDTLDVALLERRFDRSGDLASRVSLEPGYPN